MAELFRVCACVRKCVSANGRVWKRENRTVHLSEALAFPTYFKEANRKSDFYTRHQCKSCKTRQEKKKVTRGVRHSAREFSKVKKCCNTTRASPYKKRKKSKAKVYVFILPTSYRRHPCLEACACVRRTRSNNETTTTKSVLCVRRSGCVVSTVSSSEILFC
uniref:Uncharacterized protein n=1 Tax=Anopheles quadriannulatus TaxID=34691 RepID=A0A182XU08_ANOQN